VRRLSSSRLAGAVTCDESICGAASASSPPSNGTRMLASATSSPCDRSAAFVYESVIGACSSGSPKRRSSRLTRYSTVGRRIGEHDRWPQQAPTDTRRGAVSSGGGTGGVGPAPPPATAEREKLVAPTTDRYCEGSDQGSCSNSRLISAILNVRPAAWSARPSLMALMASLLNILPVVDGSGCADGALSGTRGFADGIRSVLGIVRSPSAHPAEYLVSNYNLAAGFRVPAKIRKPWLAAQLRAGRAHGWSTSWTIGPLDRSHAFHPSSGTNSVHGRSFVRSRTFLP